jgi:hypothetical protein
VHDTSTEDAPEGSAGAARSRETTSWQIASGRRPSGGPPPRGAPRLVGGHAPLEQVVKARLGEQRAVGVTRHPEHRLGEPNAQVHDLGGLEQIARVRAVGRAAAECEHRGRAIQQAGHDLVLQVAEGRLTVFREDAPDGPPGPLLDDQVAVDERQAEPVGEQAAHRSLARAHETDDDDHLPASSSARTARRART